MLQKLKLYKAPLKVGTYLRLPTTAKRVKALFTKDVKWRLVEEFGPECYTEAEGGRLLFTADYTDMDNLVTWILTFGDKAELLEPKEARDRIRNTIEAMKKNYERV